MSAGRQVNTLSQHWCTPKKYVDAVKAMFNNVIELDPCSNNFSIVKAKIEYRLPKDNGLLLEWNFKTIYVNPPYGADRVKGTTIKDWLKKCAEAHKKYNSEVLALIPVATNTAHWKYYIFGEASSICFLYDTRLKFIINGDDNNKGAPMACCMVYWGNRVEKFQSIFLKFGAVVTVNNLIGKRIGKEKEEKNVLFHKEEFIKIQAFA
ncbi:MAG: phage N-6-adenine-methyltransferase [Planctomycetaceae bacterium]|nr:phage N-6-adenine-methyltransferase [Planctomycetaceae bacterium]